MITVAININGNCILARSATNITDKVETKRHEENQYRCDDGSIIEHNPDDGAVALAHKLLDTIKEMKQYV